MILEKVVLVTVAALLVIKSWSAIACYACVSGYVASRAIFAEITCISNYVWAHIKKWKKYILNIFTIFAAVPGEPKRASTNCFLGRG